MSMDGEAKARQVRAPVDGAGASLLTNRNFILLLVAYGVSAFGDHLSEMALLKMQNALDPGVTDVTRRQAIMLFVFMFPFFVFGPAFGTLADRLPRKWIMVAADAIRAVIIFEMVFILTRIHRWLEPGLPDDAPLSMAVAMLPLALLGIFAAMFSPARLALLPTLIRQDQIVRANASTAGLGMIASIASAVVGGLLVQHFSVTANFRLDALTFVISGMCILLIRPPAIAHGRAGSGHGLSAVMDGFRYVRRHRRVAEIILISAILWAGASIMRSVIPALVKDVFGGSYADIGIYQGLLGGGILLGSIILTLLGSSLRSELAISWSLKLAGVSGLLVAAAVQFRWHQAVAGTGLLLIGVFGAGIQVSVNALLQRITPDYIRGRIFGVHDLCTMSGLLLATGLLGIPNWPSIDRHIAWIAGLTSLALFLAGLWTTLLRLRRGRFGRAITFVRNVNEFYCRLWPRVRREGICTIPAEGPVIVAANHVSTLDPFLLSATSPNRYVSFMIAREFAEIPLFRRLVELVECVPVNRTGIDVASMKAALRHLERGRCLGIFPQGRIQFPGEEVEIREGVALMALRSGALVVPAYIHGVTQRAFGDSKYGDFFSLVAPFLRRHHARVRFGAPVDLSPWKGRERDKEAYREAAELIMTRILALADGGSRSHK
ncbi:MAG: hypothetical protein DCC65_07190 [Planctomycetota bacterium]|nr:MAG: hypothetical protein DCC65_07190 [Planctomycetota bacterium]